METFEVENNEDGLLYIVKEITEGITIQEEDQNNIITNSGINSNERFDLDGEEEESDFNEEANSNTNSKNKNMQNVLILSLCIMFTSYFIIELYTSCSEVMRVQPKESTENRI